MFGGIRDKFINLQENISTTLRGLTVTDTSSRKQLTNELIPVNLNAGADVLEKFQMLWSELHHSSQENANSAEEADRIIYNLNSYAERQWKNIAHLTGVLLSLPDVCQTVNDLNMKTCALTKLFETVEKSLIQLEDISEAKELQNQKTEQEIKLALHRHKRLLKLESLRLKLEENYKAQLINHNMKIQKSVKEQKVSTDSNLEEIRTFKDASAIPKIEIGKTSAERPKSPSTSLEDIVLVNEDEANDLEEFLNKEIEEKNSDEQQS